MTFSRQLASLALVALVLGAGCRRAPGVVDPTRPDSYEACPAGAPHLTIALTTGYSEAEQVLVRYTEDLAPCRPRIVPSEDFGTLASVGGLSDGTDLVGFAGSYARGGTLARFDGDAEIGRIEEEDVTPLGIGTLPFEGQPAVAVVWGSRSSSDSGDRLDVYAEDGLARLGSWDTSYELVRAASPPSGQPGRLAGIIGEGLQEYRSDPGATTLATTGELQVTRPNGTGYVRSLDVYGEHVRVAADQGVLSWRAGAAPAFLGPVRCRWAATTDTLLPEDDADYVGAVIDRDQPEDTLVLVSGELEGGSDSTSHLYRMHRRGDCELIASMPSGYSAVGIAWSGR